MAKLVQIEDMRHASNGVDYALKVANAPRPKELLQLIDSLTAMFGRIGMHEVCRSCWAGTLADGNRKGRGCCGSCALVGHSSCLAKPLGCALYMCWDQTQPRFPRTYGFLNGLRATLFSLSAVNQGCFTGAVEQESHLKLDAHQRKSLRVLRWAVESWSEA